MGRASSERSSDFTYRRQVSHVSMRAAGCSAAEKDGSFRGSSSWHDGQRMRPNGHSTPHSAQPSERFAPSINDPSRRTEIQGAPPQKGHRPFVCGRSGGTGSDRSVSTYGRRIARDR